MENRVLLIPMTVDNFAAYQTMTRDNYAAEIAESRKISFAEAMERSLASFARILPQGIATPNQYLFTVDWQNTLCGYLWYGLNESSDAWIYDIFLLPEFRGKGLGKATLTAFEADAKARGFKRMGLHVFAHNTKARSLYTKFGLKEVSVVMQKEFL